MNSKKKIIKISVIAFVILLFAFAAIFTVVTIKNNNDKKQQEAAKNTPAAKKKAADENMTKGMEAAKDGDSDKAKQLLLDAKAKYEALNDTDKAVDADAQLYFVEHPSTPPAAPTTTNP